ncbi:MAG: PD-(D/E)XK nuclease family protein [Armatimonadetes bacterium]|nr:PD-(D/E)XK nuclease family protein [Armatimonadota bacterium]
MGRKEPSERKPSLSPTKLTTYLTCPLKYRWTYLDPRGRPFLRAKHYYSFGTTLHKVLERFHDSGDQGVQSVSDAVVAVEREWVSAGFATKEQEAQALAAGKEIVEKHVAEALSTPSEAKTLHLEWMVRADLGPFVLIGRIDRVDELSDGTLEIIDYKSGRTEVTEAEVAEDLALGCYQLLVRSRYPDRAVVASILALRTAQKATAALSPEELDGFREDLIGLGASLLSTDWTEVFPTLKPACTGCDFIRLCMEHPPFAEEWKEASAAD